jgi:hypothetical protein
MDHLFDEQFLKNLPEDQWERIIAISELYLTRNDHGLASEHHLEAFALGQEISRVYNLTPDPEFPEVDPLKVDDWNFITHGIIQTYKSLYRIAAKHKGASAYEASSARFKLFFDCKAGYELSEHQFKELQNLINQLRERITEVEGLSEEHRARLLKRLESLQQELHQKLSTLDRWYGVTMEIAIAARALAEKAKPLIALAWRIALIIYAVQSKKEGLPLPSGSDPFLLPMPTDPQHPSAPSSPD